MDKESRITELERNIRNCETLMKSKIVPQETKQGLISQKADYIKKLKKMCTLPLFQEEPILSDVLQVAIRPDQYLPENYSVLF